MSSGNDPDGVQVPDDGFHPSPETKIETVDGVFAIVTQAFCPKGHNLVDGSSVSFDDNPGIRILLSDGNAEQEVILSPVHGDKRKSVCFAYRIGTRLKIMCPECRVELPMLFPCSCGRGELLSLFLTSKLDEAHVAAVCNVWGCPRSRIIDNWQVISQFVEAGEAE